MTPNRKKSFTSGLDALLTPTTSIKEVTPEPINNPANRIEKEAFIAVHFRLPASLKIQMEHYCIDNRMTQKEFLDRAIRKYMES